MYKEYRNVYNFIIAVVTLDFKCYNLTIKEFLKSAKKRRNEDLYAKKTTISLNLFDCISF